MTDPRGEFEARLAATQRRAEQVRDGLERVRATERSDDGQITVTVNASGNVVGLTLGPKEKAGQELADDILRTIRGAQAKLAEAVHVEMSADFAGSELLADLDRQYRETYPVPEQARGARRTLRLGAEDDRAASEVPAQPARRRGPQAGDESDYGDRNLLR